MRILDVIKYDGADDTIAWKHPLGDLRIGSQLIVNQSQEAIFIKGGKIFDCFGPGTHTLSTGNLPLLNKLINLSFDGQTPFSAEILFINKTTRLDMKWGTPDPIRLTDPTYGVILKASSNGTFGFKVKDSVKFGTIFVGTVANWDTDDLSRQFKGEVVQRVTITIAQTVVKEKISLLNINAYLDEITNACFEKLAIEFDKFGISIVNFRILSLSIDNDSIAELESIMMQKEKFNQLSDNYDKLRTFDVLEKAAENSSPGNIGLSSGLGLGLGVGAGTLVGKQFGENISSALSKPKEILASPIVKCISCGIDIPQGSNFCNNCGTPVSKANYCSNCGSKIEHSSAKFCSSCGTSL